MECITKERTTEASLLADLFQEADAIVVGIDCWDVGSRWICHLYWQSIQPFLILSRKFLDMLQASLFHFPSWEAVGFQSRFITLNT